MLGSPCSGTGWLERLYLSFLAWSHKWFSRRTNISDISYNLVTVRALKLPIAIGFRMLWTLPQSTRLYESAFSEILDYYHRYNGFQHWRLCALGYYFALVYTLRIQSWLWQCNQHMNLKVVRSSACSTCHETVSLGFRDSILPIRGRVNLRHHVCETLFISIYIVHHQWPLDTVYSIDTTLNVIVLLLPFNFSW